MSRFRAHLAEHGLTEQQWRVLRILDENGPLDPTEIAERSVIMTPSMTRILRTLEDAGLITRRNHPTDRRRFLISITAQARRAIKKATPGSMAIHAEIERLYGSKRMEMLLDLLEDLSQIRLARNGKEKEDS